MLLVALYGLVLSVCLLLGAALYFVGGTAAVSSGSPLLVLTLAVGLFDVAFARYGFAPYRLLPRRLRLQYGLEFSLFRWNDAPEQRDAILSHLRVAQRAAQGPLRAEIDRIVSLLLSHDKCAQSAVGADLRASIAKLASARGERFPHTQSSVLPAFCVLPLSTLLAFTAVIPHGLWSQSGRLTLLDAIWGAVLLAFFYAVLRLVHLVGAKAHAVKSQLGFRTLFVTDEFPFDPMNRLAVRLYGGAGHLAAIFVGADPNLPWHRFDTAGMDSFSPSKEEVGRVLAAFVDNADLLVLNTQNESLAANIRTAANLPNSRCLALSKDGSVPQGYTWVEPAALRSDVSQRLGRKSGSDPSAYSMGVLPGLSVWKDRFLHMSLLGCAALLWIDGSLALVILVALSAIGRVVPDLLGPSRRSTISREVLRAPRAPEFSHRLHPGKLGRNLTIIAGVTMVVAIIPSVLAADIDWQATRQWELLYLTLMVWAWFPVSVGFVGGLLIAQKWYLDWNFRIVIFRRNSRRFGYAHKSIVMATCGKYGQVLIIGDDSLDQTDQDYGEWRESSQGAWLQIFSEMNNTLRPVAFLHDWKRQVLTELEVADFAVFDWAEDVTDNMKWELLMTVKHLPGTRVLLVHNDGNLSQVQELLATPSCPDLRNVTCLSLPRERDDEYIWPSNAQFAAGFGDTLHQMIAQLRVEPRKPRADRICGTWPLPRAGENQAAFQQASVPGEDS